MRAGAREWVTVLGVSAPEKMDARYISLPFRWSPGPGSCATRRLRARPDRGPPGRPGAGARGGAVRHQGAGALHQQGAQRTAEQDAAEAERNKNWDPNAPLAGKTPAPARAAAASAASAAWPRQPRRPRARRQPAAPASAVRARPGRHPGGQRPGAGPRPRQVHQAGAPTRSSTSCRPVPIARTEDAEHQRAKLALLGMAARVTEREQSGRTVYRVRMGPFERTRRGRSTRRNSWPARHRSRPGARANGMTSVPARTRPGVVHRHVQLERTP